MTDLNFKQRNDDIDYPIGSLIKFHWHENNLVLDYSNQTCKIGMVINKTNGLNAGSKIKRNNYFLHVFFDGKVIKIPNYTAEEIT